MQKMHKPCKEDRVVVSAFGRSKKHLQHVADMRAALEAEAEEADDALYSQLSSSSNKMPAAAARDGAASRSPPISDAACASAAARSTDEAEAKVSQPGGALGRSRKQQKKKLRKQAAQYAVLEPESNRGGRLSAAAPPFSRHSTAATPAVQTDCDIGGDHSSSNLHGIPDGTADKSSAQQSDTSVSTQDRQICNTAAVSNSSSECDREGSIAEMGSDCSGDCEGDENAMLRAMMRNHSVRQRPAVTNTTAIDHSLSDQPDSPTGSSRVDGHQAATEDVAGSAVVTDRASDSEAKSDIDLPDVKKPRHRKGRSRKGQLSTAGTIQNLPVDAPVPTNALECGACHVVCASRTALFRHIAEAGHAVVKR